MGQISSHLLDYYTELTKQTWLAQLVGQIRALTAQQNQMMQQVADAVNAAQFENEDALAFAIIKKQEEMKAGETYLQLDRKVSDLKKQLPSAHLTTSTSSKTIAPRNSSTQRLSPSRQP